MTNWSHFSEQNPGASQRIAAIKVQATLARNTESELYGFSIDTTRVQIIKQVGFTTYAFSAIRQYATPGIWENYLYKQNDDGTYQQYLLGYFCTSDTEGNIHITTEDLQITPIDDPSIMSRGSCYPEFVQVGEYTVCTTATVCYGSNTDGQHTNSAECQCEERGLSNCFEPGTESCRDVPVFGWTNCPGGPPDNTPPDPDPNNPGGDGATNPDLGGQTQSIPVPPVLAYQGILNCINGILVNGPADTITIDPAILSQISLNVGQWTAMKNYLQDNGCSLQAQAEVVENIYAIIRADLTACLGSEHEVSINSLSHENLEQFILTSLLGMGVMRRRRGLLKTLSIV